MHYLLYLIYLNGIFPMLLLSVICLVLCLYAWFKMLTSGWDSKKYGEGFGILKSAALWLAIIGTSRLIVSLIFYVIMWSVNPNILWCILQHYRQEL